MVDAWFLLDAMDGIREEQLLLAGDFLGLAGPERGKRRGTRKAWTTLLIAAVLALLLAACGYAVSLAAMAYRELDPEAEKTYYFNGLEGSPNEGLHMDLNFGDCAMALHFETEETGHAHAFRLKEGAPVDPSWRSGGFSMNAFFRSYEPGGSQPLDQQRPLEQCLREAGMTAEEAEEWSFSLTFSGEDQHTGPAMRIDLYDGPRLHDLDLIVGWPAGKATVVKDETRGDVRILEALVELKNGEEEPERILYLFRFDARQQTLLSMAGAEWAVDFPGLEAILEQIELRETGFVYSCDRRGQNFSILGLAYG